MSLKGFRIFVSGRVQGVFFRDFTRRSAIKTGISGFVQNKPNGCVYVQCYGEETKLLTFIGLLKKGPEMARVDSVKIEEIEYLPSYQSFQIRH